MTKRRVRTFLIIFTISAVACLTAIPLLCRDEPPPKDDDLRSSRVQIPDDQNAIHYFILAQSEMHDFSWTLLSGDGPWNAEDAEDTLSRNRKFFELLEKGLACKEAIEPPSLEAVEGCGWFELYLHYQWLIIRARQMAFNGNDKAALDDALRIIKFGHILQTCRGGFHAFYHGSKAKYAGFTWFHKLLKDVKLERSVLQDYMARLQAFRSDGAVLAEKLKAEYEADRRNGDPQMVKFRYSGPDELFAPVWGYSYKPNKTRRRLAEQYRIAIANLTRPYADRTPFDPPRYSEIPTIERRLHLIALLQPNYVGEAGVYQSGVAFLQHVASSTCEDDTRVSATRILIALKCHKLKTGSLPKSLDELVPEYFDNVPLDQFDRKPMRYLPDRRIIYSVGADLFDCAGLTQQENGGAGDIIFNIEF